VSEKNKKEIQEAAWGPFNHQKAYKLLVDITQILDRKKVPYHLEGGTLLGLHRDGELLSWDDDLDISVPAEYSRLAFKALLPLMLKGWRLDKRKMEYHQALPVKGLRMFKVRDRSRGLLRSGRVYMDIFTKYEYEGYCYWQAKGRLMRVDAKYYNGFDTITVNGDSFKVPKQFENYLTEKYGDWGTPVKEWDCGRDEKTIVE
jgi:lipopolysaccharide cholinephosphotransferase